MSGRGVGRLVAAAALALSAAACEPSGPGDLDATVTTPVPTGAAVIQVVGRGIDGFEGQGDVRVFAEPGTPADTIRKIILVSPSGGALRFRIEVRDVSADPPRALVLSAVDPANRAIASVTGYVVRVAR